MKFHVNPLTVSELSVLLFGALVFIILIGVDICKALKKGAQWVPGHALVLSALTIQVMNLVELQSGSLQALLDPDGHHPKLQDKDSVESLFIIIHASRVMLCVLTALFLPGMARPGYEEGWTKIAALGFSVFLDILFGLLVVYLHSDSGDSIFYLGFSFREHNISFRVSGVIISISLLWLIQLLISSTIANKSIRNITAERIPLILEHPTQNSWNAVEDQVLKSWIVFLACNPESMIARSVLASSAALAVTVCIVSSLVGWIAWIARRPSIHFLGVGSPLKFVITILELIFILIGWAVISWRYLSSVAYYPKWKTDSWGKYFRVEHFWTSHIENLLQKKEESHLLKPSEDRKINKIIATEETEICLQKELLRCMIFLQRFVILFSKGCWLLAEITLYNRLIRNLASVIFSNHIKKVDKDFKDYKAILERVYIVGETPRSVFVTHRKSIKRAMDLKREGYNHGKDCDTLITFLKEKKSTGLVGTQCLDPGNSQTGLNFLCKLGPGPVLGVEKYFMYIKKQSWKLTAVSLINIIFRLSAPSGEDALNAYSQAMELMGLVENSDPETDLLLSKAADRLLKTLPPSPQSFQAITTMEGAAEEIKKLAEDAAKSIKMFVEKRGKEIAEESNEAGMICNIQETSVDWENIAAGNALYKLCMTLDCRSGNFTELMNELESSLADIIAACLKKVGVALVDSCSKWAKDLEERKLLEALYIAGKSKGLMERLEWDPNLQIAPITEEPAAMV